MRITTLSFIGFLVASAAAHAAGNPRAVNQLPPNDPTAAKLTPYEITLRAFDACLITQSRLLGTTREAVHTPCSCYARRTIANMTKDELNAFRRTGYFNDSAQAKGLEAIDYCKLKRPI
ncbi:hypothetical protein [Camelimonas lactis]|uniref:Uncharacterized protein n=1 Tax=Camelimonas lactis TaxID=659006 RepID=A0A4R2GWP4_9HYPH|nr:hypothetical protein [Camelimonas lactis]TCO15286.1 hypothetical protein EV666_102265 [Camelimonas lactis]